MAIVSSQETATLPSTTETAERLPADTALGGPAPLPARSALHLTASRAFLMPALWYFRSPAGEFSIRYRSDHWEALLGTKLLCTHTSPQQVLNDLLGCHAFRFPGTHLPGSLCDWQFALDERLNEEAIHLDAVASYETLIANVRGKLKADS